MKARLNSIGLLVLSLLMSNAVLTHVAASPHSMRPEAAAADLQPAQTPPFLVGERVFQHVPSPSTTLTTSFQLAFASLEPGETLGKAIGDSTNALEFVWIGYDYLLLVASGVATFHGENLQQGASFDLHEDEFGSVINETNECVDLLVVSVGDAGRGGITEKTAEAGPVMINDRPCGYLQILARVYDELPMPLNPYKFSLSILDVAQYGEARFAATRGGAGVYLQSGECMILTDALPPTYESTEVVLGQREVARISQETSGTIRAIGEESASLLIIQVMEQDQSPRELLSDFT